ncbi:MAG: hypothetical protein JNJ45_01035 [Chthonomonas sp.]|nr:hypothetical protein [Chthonomonas sp.]
MSHLSAEFFACLAAIGDEAATPKALLRWGERWSADVVRAAVEQRQLRQRAAARFDFAHEWLWDADTMQMATHPRLARYHASKFLVGEPVVDLTAGAGVDLRAIAQRGRSVGVELDPARAERLAANFAGSAVEVICGDGLEVAASQPGVSLFADPARRSGGKRAARLEDGLPNPRLVAELAAGRPRLVMKLWPGADVDDVLALGATAVEVVSYRHECREVLALFGAASEPGVWAVCLSEDSELRLQREGALAVASPALGWIGQLDVAAARLGLAGQLGFQSLWATRTYVTSAEPVPSAWVRSSFRVLNDAPFDRKSLRAWVRESGRLVDAVKIAGGLEIRPEDVEKTMNQGLRGPRHLVLLIYPADTGVRCAVCELST